MFIRRTKVLELWMSLPRPEDPGRAPKMKGCGCEQRTTLEFLACRWEYFNLGPETRLDHLELLCSKVLLKHKTDKASDNRQQKGAEKIAPCQFLARHLMPVSKLLIIDSRNSSRLRELHQVSLPLHTYLHKGSPLQTRCLWVRYIVSTKQLM